MAKRSLFAGPLLAMLVGVVLWHGEFPSAVCWTAGVTTLCAMWWIFETIPIPATSLLPLALFPLVGVLPPEAVAAAYGSPLVLLMLGGFMLSAAMERSGAHRRIALQLVALFGGGSGKGLVFGFMAASALLSMWISNSATTLMLLPIAMAVVQQSPDTRLRISLLLGVAYGASVGGIATPIGTPPNLIFMEIYRQTIGEEVSFMEWMTWALPVVVIMLPAVGLWLTRGLRLETPIRLPPVGRWRAAEVRTLGVFAATAALWVTRQSPFGGWQAVLDLPAANDASVALLAVVAMFLIPNGTGGKLLDWPTARKIEWGILILFGGGITIAKAFVSSGLSESLGSALAGIGEWPLPLTVAMVCLSVTFLTEVTSNTASTNLLLPILAATALTAGIDPRHLMVPATLSASFAFMLPVATPPNAIIFSSGVLTVRAMAREGFIVNLIGAAIVSAWCLRSF